MLRTLHRTLLAALTALALMASGGAWANTSVTWTGQGTTDGQLNTLQCSGDTADPGTLLWIFTFGQPNATNPITDQNTTLTINGTDVYQGTQNGNEIHFITDWYTLDPSVTVAIAFSTGDVGRGNPQLTISHGCPPGGEGGDHESAISTEIHLGATDADPDNPIVVDACNVLAGSTVHDSAQVTTLPASELPANSSVTFYFYQNADCTAPPFANSGPIYVDGQTNPYLDPYLAEGPLSAFPTGSYSYRAFFTSGDTSATGFPDANSACEPFQVYSAALTPGYWKNHLAPLSASCTSKQGCSANGPWANQYLPQYLGNFPVGDTATVTAVFNKMNCGSSTDQDAVGCLAGHLLATKLNLANHSDPCIASTVADADAFLISIGYTGPTWTGTLDATHRAQAISLKTALDQYNNGGGCNNFCQ
jgi:hypothetical protein